MDNIHSSRSLLNIAVIRNLVEEDGGMLLQNPHKIFDEEIIETQDCWLTANNEYIPIKQLGNDHLARIPRHLIKGGADVPIQIIEEIKRRGWTINKRGFVKQN